MRFIKIFCITLPHFDCRSSETVASDGDGVVAAAAFVPSDPPANGVDWWWAVVLLLITLPPPLHCCTPWQPFFRTRPPHPKSGSICSCGKTGFCFSPHVQLNKKIHAPTRHSMVPLLMSNLIEYTLSLWKCVVEGTITNQPPLGEQETIVTHRVLFCLQFLLFWNTEKFCSECGNNIPPWMGGGSMHFVMQLSLHLSFVLLLYSTHW